MEQDHPEGPEDQDAVDAVEADDDDWEPAPTTGQTALPPRIEAWRRRSAAGAVLTGIALGLQQALEKRKEEPSIVMETSGEPPQDLPVEADFEYGRPRQSVVQIRPWLLGDAAAAPSGTDPAEAGPEDTDPQSGGPQSGGPAGSDEV
ncbi:MAG TPA: hypothetical protein VKI19_03880 [Acidimicrobiales bacterium]|nr:hypothetical protein [Acidimicrobiales bacterium]